MKGYIFVKLWFVHASDLICYRCAQIVDEADSGDDKTIAIAGGQDETKTCSGH